MSTRVPSVKCGVSLSSSFLLFFSFCWVKNFYFVFFKLGLVLYRADRKQPTIQVTYHFILLRLFLNLIVRSSSCSCLLLFSGVYSYMHECLLFGLSSSHCCRTHIGSSPLLAELQWVTKKKESRIPGREVSYRNRLRYFK